MDSKLPLYHWLVVLVPGSIFLSCIYFVLQVFGISIPTLNIPGSETVRAFVFLASALLTGELLQAFGGIIEPILFWTWGGSPSKILLSEDKYKREVKELRIRFAGDLTKDELFEKAMAYCNHHSLGRSEYFNTLYAYSRSLFTGTLFILAFMLFFSSANFHRPTFWYLVLFEIVVAIVLWHRTKKRGRIFAKEVTIQVALSITQK